MTYVPRVKDFLRAVKRESWQARKGAEWQFGYVVGQIPSRRLREFLYRRLMGLDADPSAKIHRRLRVLAPRNITVGAGTIIGEGALLDGRCGITLGSNVNIGGEVAVFTMAHDVRSPAFSSVGARVTVGDRVWLSFRTTILPGVTIGEGAVVAAGAVVTKDVPPYVMVAGVPAAVIAERPRDLVYDFSKSRAPWFI